MKQLIKIIFAVMLVAASACVLAAGNIDAGKEKSTSCATCHGADGVSESAMYPTIAGQHADYLVHALHAYKTGKRKNRVMQKKVAKLSDEDIADLAAYFASQTGLQTLKR